MTNETPVPPDLHQCQAEKSNSEWSFMRLGPCPKMIRCTAAPKWIATEAPRKDGEPQGSMSLCDDCKKVCEKRLPATRFKPIETVDLVVEKMVREVMVNWCANRPALVEPFDVRLAEGLVEMAVRKTLRENDVRRGIAKPVIRERLSKGKKKK